MQYTLWEQNTDHRPHEGACVGWRSVCLRKIIESRELATLAKLAACSPAKTMGLALSVCHKAKTWCHLSARKGVCNFLQCKFPAQNCKGCYFLQPQEHRLLNKFCKSYFLFTRVIEAIKNVRYIMRLVDIKDSWKSYLSKGKYPYRFQLIYYR